MDSQLSTLSSQLRAGRRRGFALLIVVTLLAFIVLLLVGLAAFTRVETSIAGNTQRQAQARENALLALNVALGQLQKHAGPDKRVTATAASFGGGTGTRHHTGVWPSDPADDPDGDPSTPLTWLVSGNELFDADGNARPLAVVPAGPLPANASAELVGLNTSRTAGDVRARLVPIAAAGVPGTAPGTTSTVGRYAWWVGDQGVKAPVAIPDTTSAITFAPYGDGSTQNDLGRRIRQQIALGAGAADATGAPVFEPLDANNATLVAGNKVASSSQFAFLRNASNAQVGLTRAQQNFHAWSPNNFAVLANTRLGGLRQDLSLAPSLLGGAYAAWSNPAAYMEPLVAPPVEPGSEATPAPVVEFPITPAYGADPVRRRYKFTPPLAADGAIHSVAPVLSFFGLSFSVREAANAPQMEVAARCVITLWNPYTSALVPESLRVEVEGLPRIRVEDSAGGDHGLDLQRAMAGGAGVPLRFSLPWTNGAADVDRHSWLPGRVYSWAATENFSEPAGGNPMVSHYPDSRPPGAGQGIVRPAGIHHHTLPATATAEVTRQIYSIAPTVVRVRILRASDDTELATYALNVGQFGPTNPLPVKNKFVDFAIIRRLPETDELPSGASEKWLTAAGRDPRRPGFPGDGFIGGVNGDDPARYGGDNVVDFKVRSPARLLDRGGNEFSYNQDVPLFELPRAPLLSLGELQHLQLADARPFAIGNPWGVAAAVGVWRAGELFDRFFFSGLVSGVTPAVNAQGDLVLPNPLHKPLRNPDGTKPNLATVAALQADAAADSAAAVRTAKHLLQGGAFNLNSRNAAAWASVLRGVRFPAPKSFSFLSAELASGSADDSALGTVQSADAQFFRFPQTAQETYRTDAGAASEDPSEPSNANTHLFRQGMRTLTAAQVAALAAKIAELVGLKHGAAEGAGGPFRSLEEFLSPNALFAGTDASGNPAPRSLLEAALADAGVNSEIAEFSSQWLTQADIMTALAPVLFPRSDTFVIRAYGEAVNPATNATEGRAWCEATVQRVPDYVDPLKNAGTDSATGDAAEVAPANLTSDLNKQLGRRFKVVSFRWLTRSDI